MIKVVNGKKYYPVSERILFGLESMYEKCQYHMECEYDELTVEEYNYWKALAKECIELRGMVGNTGYLPGKQYTRAKKITTEREFMRYNACLAAGMSEREAGRCFG